MKRRIIIGLSLLAAVLWIITGLRDIFAPGFFTFSPRVVGRSDIIFEFATATVFLALAVLAAAGRPDAHGIHKK